jgi:hypothetical protein
MKLPQQIRVALQRDNALQIQILMKTIETGHPKESQVLALLLAHG